MSESFVFYEPGVGTYHVDTDGSQILEPDRGGDAISWPAPLAPPAMHGITGDVVRLIEPHSEADPNALAAQFLVIAGSIIGPRPYYDTDGARQHLNENLLVVGPTSSGRKGTGYSQIRAIAARVDPDWATHRISSGLSSGEGLIYHVRDALDDDPGVSDKRLLIVEPEFASALKVLRRDGNTLSPLLRQAWDSAPLGTLTRSAPIRATNTHISAIGHITPDELRLMLGQVDAANGVLNRFLIVATKRSKYLPDGGSPGDRDVETIADVIRNVVARARHVGRVVRTDTARDLWHSVYQDLSDRPGGLLGKATSRAAPHVVRLSCIYALLDGVAVVDAAHLEAALAVWRYVEDSTRFFLGDSLGDPCADEVLAALRAAPEGLDKTQLHRMKNGHWTAEKLNVALQQLANDGLAVPEKKGTKGRPKEVWIAAKYEKKANKGGL